MMTKEEYKKEIVRMWDSLRDDKYKGRIKCVGVKCDKSCALYNDDIIRSGCSLINAFEAIETVGKWSKEHPEKHKISKLEYEILKIYSDDYFYYFYESELLMLLLKKGQFKGATSKTNIINYLNNCEVEEDV